LSYILNFIDLKAIFIYLILLFAWVWPHASRAQYAQDPVPVHDSFTIVSNALNEVRMINIWTPSEYADETEALPVLYMLDGGIKEDFPHLANTIDTLIQTHKIPPVILVGIENTQRRRDLTGPTNVKKDKEIAPVVGGSEAFRAFVRDELIREINTRYRTTSSRGIIGESLAGLFVTETFFLQPGLFDIYIAFDPSLWWNDTYLLKTATQHLAGFPTSPKTFWFAGSGAKDIYKNAEKLADVLKGQALPNLKWQYNPEKHEQHSTIFRSTKESALIWSLNSQGQP